MSKRGMLLLDAAIVACIVLVYSLWNEFAIYLPACPIREHLGIYCAGCGGTRFVYHLMNFDFSLAFANNPYLFLLTAYLMLSFVLFNISVLSGRKIHTMLLNEKWLWFWAISAVLFFVLRNIPFMLFSYLAPLG